MGGKIMNTGDLECAKTELKKGAERAAYDYEYCGGYSSDSQLLRHYNNQEFILGYQNERDAMNYASDEAYQWNLSLNNSEL